MLLKAYFRSNSTYFPGDLDKALLANDEHRPWSADVQTARIVDVAVWRQKDSMTVQLFNLTNAMIMKGPFRDLIPVETEVGIQIPANKKVTGVVKNVSL